MSVQAQSEYSALSDGLLMTAVDATQYFPKLTVVGSDATRQYGPGLDMPYSVSQTSAKKHYKIAYLILAHENPDALVRLMQSLYSSDGLYMIHIDAKVPKLQSDIDQWLKQNEKVLEKNKNVFLMKDPFELQWGSSSIVMAQLEGFFQLLDLATWDYVVNLSVYDYPLLSTGALHKKLEAEAPGKSYISYWKDDKEMFYRLSSVVFSRADKKHMVADQAVRQFPFLNLYPIYKHHQWMVSV